MAGRSFLPGRSFSTCVSCQLRVHVKCLCLTQKEIQIYNTTRSYKCDDCLRCKRSNDDLTPVRLSNFGVSGGSPIMVLECTMFKSSFEKGVSIDNDAFFLLIMINCSVFSLACRKSYLLFTLKFLIFALKILHYNNDL